MSSEGSPDELTDFDPSQLLPRQPTHTVASVVTWAVVMAIVAVGAAVLPIVVLGPAAGLAIDLGAIVVYVLMRVVMACLGWPRRSLAYEIRPDGTVLAHGDVSTLIPRAARLNHGPVRKLARIGLLVLAIVLLFGAVIAVPVVLDRPGVALGYPLLLLIGAAEALLRMAVRARRRPGLVFLDHDVADSFALEYVWAGGQPDRLRSGISALELIPDNEAQLERAMIRVNALKALRQSAASSS